MDFTITTYKKLLNSLLTKYEVSKSFYDYLIDSKIDSFKEIYKSIIILRHDVDRLPYNALRLAEIEKSYGISGTYYFRIIPSVFNADIIYKISKLGHEIGYHYEDVDLVLKNFSGKNKKLTEDQIIDLAYDSFCKNLGILKQNFDIKTICMHGSPLSKYDNKIIWKKYNYKELGILGDPYLDIDWNEWGYFTDTGRRWNGNKINVRDKVISSYNFSFKNTYDIIKNSNELPKKVMLTIHPERWNDNLYYWLRELLGQNIKNVVKYVLLSKYQ